MQDEIPLCPQDIVSKLPIALTCVPPSSHNGLTPQVWVDVYTQQGRAWQNMAGLGRAAGLEACPHMSRFATG